MIQQLLAEAGAAGVPRDLVAVEGKGAEAAADWGSLRSPEAYLGYERAENRVNATPARLWLNQWTASGDWSARKQAIVLNKPNGRIAYRFHARDLHMVMGPAMAGGSVRFRVLIDGKPPGPAHGGDIDAQGNGAVTEQRMYQLIRQPKPIGDRLFEIDSSIRRSRPTCSPSAERHRLGNDLVEQQLDQALAATFPAGDPITEAAPITPVMAPT